VSVEDAGRGVVLLPVRDLFGDFSAEGVASALTRHALPIQVCLAGSLIR
jgi:hypothetical protein